MPSRSPRKRLGELLKQARAEAITASRRPADVALPLVVRLVALTPAARALLRWAEQQDLGEKLVRLIAAELQTGEWYRVMHGSGGREVMSS